MEKDESVVPQGVSRTSAESRGRYRLQMIHKLTVEITIHVLLHPIRSSPIPSALVATCIDNLLSPELSSSTQNTASAFRIIVRNALTPMGCCAGFGLRLHIAGNCAALGDAGDAVEPAPPAEPAVPAAEALEPEPEPVPEVVLFDTSLALRMGGKSAKGGGEEARGLRAERERVVGVLRGVARPERRAARLVVRICIRVRTVALYALRRVSVGLRGVRWEDVLKKL